MKMQQLLLAAVAMLVSMASATAQPYPSRPITIVVPFAAGGPTDTLARTLAERMRASLGQTLIIENATGAGGSLGVGRVARAAPDGYTVGIGNWSTHVVNGAIYALPYDLLSDLAPIALLPSNPQLIVTKKTLPANNLRELIAWLRANSFSAGTGGAGTASHIAGVFFQNLTGIHVQLVPYRATGPAIQDLAAGQIDLMFDQSSNSLPHVRAGKIKAYAVTGRERLASAPDIPTVDEAGLSGFHMSVWHGLWAPKATPTDVIAKLNASAAGALADPNVRQRLADLGLEIPAGDQQAPEALGVLQKAEIKKWWPLIKAANIKGE